MRFYFGKNACSSLASHKSRGCVAQSELCVFQCVASAAHFFIGRRKMQEKKLTGYPSIDKPWEKYYAARPVVTLPQNTTLYQQFIKKVKDNPDALAFIDYISGSKKTYGALLAEVDQFAAALTSKGLKCFDTIGVLGFLCSVDPVAVLGANKIGVTVKFIDADRSPVGLVQSIENLSLLVMENLFHPAEPIMNTKSVPVVVYGESSEPFRDNCISYYDFLKSANGEYLEESPFDDRRASLIIYSSGSTGEAKPIVHSDKTITAAIEKMLNADFPIEPTNILLKAIPSYIGLGSITTMLTALLSGTAYIQLKGMPDPVVGLANETVALLKDYKHWLIAHDVDSNRGLLIFAAPYFADFILNAIDDIEDLSFVKGILLGGAKMERETVDRMDTVFRLKGLNVPIGNGYGQNEMGGAVALNTVHYNKNGSAGYPVYKTEIRIVDRNTFNELPFHTTGLILEQSESSFLYYDQMPEKTNAAKIQLPDGSVWYDSTDLGYMDEDGFVFITGRTTRVVIRADHKVSLEAIEEKLRHLTFITDVAVVAEYTGKDVFAFITTSQEIDVDALKQEIESKSELSVFEMPTQIAIYRELPRMNNGKIDYRALEKQAEEMSLE